MTQLSERQLFTLMDGMTDQQLAAVVERVGMQLDSAMPANAIRSVKNKVFAKAGIARPAKERRARAWLAMAASLILIVVIATMGDTVWANVKQAFNFIPFFNITVEEDSIRYILPAPVEQQVNNGTLRVEGVMLDNAAAIIVITGENIPVYRDTAIRIGDKYFEAAGWSIMEKSNTDWQGTFWYEGDSSGVSDLSVVLAGAPDVIFELELVEAATYYSFSELGPTDTVNDLSITAVAVMDEESRLEINFVSPPPIDGAYETEYTFGEIVLTDTQGHSFSAVETTNWFSKNRITFDVSGAEQEQGQLTLSSILATKLLDQSIRIPIPSQGRQHVSEIIEVAGCPLEITAVERIGEDMIRLHVDVFSQGAARFLHRVRLEGVGSYMTKMNDSIEYMLYYEIPIDPGSSQMTLRFRSADIVLRGPWKFDIPLK